MSFFKRRHERFTALANKSRLPTDNTVEKTSNGALRLTECISNILAGRKAHPLPTPVTTSFGITSSTPDDTLDSLIRCTDQALYTVKESGGNRCIIFHE